MLVEGKEWLWGVDGSLNDEICVRIMQKCIKRHYKQYEQLVNGTCDDKSYCDSVSGNESQNLLDSCRIRGLLRVVKSSSVISSARNGSHITLRKFQI